MIIPRYHFFFQLENVSIRTFGVVFFLFLTMVLEIWYSRLLIEHMQFIKSNSKICLRTSASTYRHCTIAEAIVLYRLSRFYNYYLFKPHRQALYDY